MPVGLKWYCAGHIAEDMSCIVKRAVGKDHQGVDLNQRKSETTTTQEEIAWQTRCSYDILAYSGVATRSVHDENGGHYSAVGK